MSAAKVQVCPECKSALVYDVQSCETSCSGCGIVLDDHLRYAGLNSTSLDGFDPSKTIADQNTFAQHDLGIATNISKETKDFSGQLLSPAAIQQSKILHKWQTRIRVANSQERRMSAVLKRIVEICRKLDLPQNIIETSSIDYRKINSAVSLSGKNTTAVSIALILIACRKCGVLRSLKEISLKVSEDEHAKIIERRAYNIYKEIKFAIGIEVPVFGTDMHISKIANRVGANGRILKLALDIAKSTKDDNAIMGKSTHGIAAAYLYVASVLTHNHALRRDILYTSGHAEITIRNRCKNILANYHITIRLSPASK